MYGLRGADDGLLARSDDASGLPTGLYVQCVRHMVAAMTQPERSTLPNITWLTVAEVAAYLRVTPVTVWRWTKSGSLPSVRVGGSIRIDEASVKAFIENRGS
jgi:excisionase family DNA binding protein